MSPGTDPARPLRRIVAAVAVLVLGLSSFAAFRAEDWFNLEQGARALHGNPFVVFTRANAFGFYRPLTDWYQGTMFRLWGLEPWPHVAGLMALMAIQLACLAGIARRRGRDPLHGWIVVAAVLAQPNTWGWTVFWISNATGSLATTFVLAAVWFHHRAVDRADERHGAVATTLAAALALAAALICKEDAVLLPVGLVAMEWSRRDRLSPPARRTLASSLAVLTALVAVYTLLRIRLLPPHLGGGMRYSLSLGGNWVRNLGFFALHLLPLWLTVRVLTWVLPQPASRADERGRVAPLRATVLGPLIWLLVSLQLYLPIIGHGYGYLYLPGMVSALALTPWLGSIARADAGAGRHSRAALMLGVHAVMAALLTVAGLFGAGWFRYRALERETFAALDHALPDPPAGARIAFLDPWDPETLSGRSLFNMAFDDVEGSMVRLHYRRPDLTALEAQGPAARALAESLGAPAHLLAAGRSRARGAFPANGAPALDSLRAATVVFFVRDGHLTLIRRAERDPNAGRTPAERPRTHADSAR